MKDETGGVATCWIEPKMYSFLVDQKIKNQKT